jgi:putative DNA primase/helicase
LDIGFLILDNLSSLAPGIDENSKMEFDPVNRWLQELRFHKVAVVMTHHVGKSREQRGTTSHEDHVDVSLMIMRPRGYQVEEGCKFICRVDKDRTFVTQGKEFCLQLVEAESGRLEFATIESEDGKGVKLFQENPNLTKEEALKKGMSKATYYRTKKKFYEMESSLTDDETM